MIRALPCRRRESAFSALYGAFGVVLVTLAVAGLLARSLPEAHDLPRQEDAAAAAFLEALLGSNVGASGGTMRQYLSNACLEKPCSAEEHLPAEVESNLTAAARGLAGGLGRAWGLAVYTPAGEWLKVGSLAPGSGAGLGRADVFHPGSLSFLTVAAWLGPA